MRSDPGNPHAFRGLAAAVIALLPICAMAFSAGEIDYCEAKRHPAQHYAARFAAKEAVIKALAPGGLGGSFWRDVEIRNEASGRPVVVLSGRLRAVADGLGASRVHVTMSHTRELALAAVVVEA